MTAASTALALLLAGCGGGGGSKQHAKTTTSKTPSTPQTETQTERTETATTPAGGTQTHTSTSPEDQQGGAGDEQPARTQALFTGKGGRVTPTVVRVPSYISVRVELRSGDGRSYELRFPGHTLKVGGGVSSMSADFAGLRPGKAIVGEPVGRGNKVRVEATAEPGP